MNWAKDLFEPGWWKWALVGVACGLLFHLLCGCSSTSVSEPRYPEHEKWWTGSRPRRSTNLSELGQGDILVFENGQEVMLL